MMSLNSLRLAIAALALCNGLAGAAQMPGAHQASAVDPKLRAQTVAAVAHALRESYVFPDAGRRMATAIETKARRGEYDRIASGEAFAEALTRDLQNVQKDGHLSVSFSPASPAHEPGTVAPPPDPERMARMQRSTNFGFDRIERLPGNVGYLELNGFADPQLAGDTAVAAMRYLAHTDALIIDLRYNGGGVPGIAQLISSYFFSGRPIHLHSIRWRKDDREEQFWTLPYVPGARYGDRPLYILTSRHTVSAPESFAYSLQARGRATIVGERTGGAANPGGRVRVNDHFTLFLPTGAALNPVTGTNWEGTGISPDIETPATHAMRAAHLAALKKLLESATDPQRRQQLESAATDLEKEK